MSAGLGGEGSEGAGGGELEKLMNSMYGLVAKVEALMTACSRLRVQVCVCVCVCFSLCLSVSLSCFSLSFSLSLSVI